MKPVCLNLCPGGTSSSLFVGPFLWGYWHRFLWGEDLGTWAQVTLFSSPEFSFSSPDPFVHSSPQISIRWVCWKCSPLGLAFASWRQRDWQDRCDLHAHWGLSSNWPPWLNTGNSFLEMSQSPQSTISLRSWGCRLEAGVSHGEGLTGRVFLRSWGVTNQIPCTWLLHSIYCLVSQKWLRSMKFTELRSMNFCFFFGKSLMWIFCS